MIKRHFKKILAAVAACVFIAVTVSYISSNTTEKKAVLTGALLQILSLYHYSPEKVDDSLSVKAYNLYVKRIDFDKMYLTKSDLSILETYKYKIDDEIRAQTFGFYELSIELMDKKTAFIKEYYPKILEQPVDLNINEDFESDDEKRGYAQNDKELLELWRKTLKFQVLQKLQELEEEQSKAKAKSDTVVLKTLPELEVIAREKIKKRIDDRFQRFDKLKEEDRFSFYINAIVSVYDPHTNYFPPDDKEDFDIRISGKLEGIGATLSEKDGYIKVEAIVPGSASWRQGQLQASDIIQKVAQGDDDPVDISGMRLDEAVRLIRGPKGTKVVLTVKKTDGTIIKIPIIRDVVVIEETYAKSAILTDESTKLKIGYLYLPQFYLDFNDPNGRNCSRDVMAEIGKLQTAGVDAIIFDLRDNGGGSLNDVVKIGGYFIPSGPIVQVKSREKTPQILADLDQRIQYSGPLVVMVDEFSASASEIFAAAMQDYGRAVIVGSKSSFGKGTVQRFVNLDDYIANSYDSLKPFGQVKITIQKFYRINGGATQLKGVVPDIILPDKYEYLSLGESEQDNPMKWDEIQPVSYQRSGNVIDLVKLKKKSEARMLKDTSCSSIKEAATYLKQQRDETKFSLNYEVFKKDESISMKKSEQINKVGKYDTGLKIIPIEVITATNKLDSVKIKRQEDWFKNLKKDYQLHETFQIANDLIKN